MNYSSYFIITIILTIVSQAHINAQKTDFEQSKNAISTINVSPDITKMVDIKFKENYKDNYKIQLYYGNLNNAHTTLSKFNKYYNQWEGRIKYETPNYKVWVGDYNSRLEADRALMKISNKFPTAFIFKP